MPVLYASIYGGGTALLIGFGIAIFHDMTLPDALFRLCVLASGGTVLGGLMAWLDDMLAPQTRDREAYKQTESRR